MPDQNDRSVESYRLYGVKIVPDGDQIELIKVGVLS